MGIRDLQVPPDSLICFRAASSACLPRLCWYRLLVSPQGCPHHPQPPHRWSEGRRRGSHPADQQTGGRGCGIGRAQAADRGSCRSPGTGYPCPHCRKPGCCRSGGGGGCSVGDLSDSWRPRPHCPAGPPERPPSPTKRLLFCLQEAGLSQGLANGALPTPAPGRTRWEAGEGADRGAKRTVLRTTQTQVGTQTCRLLADPPGCYPCFPPRMGQ